jgi:hypothetical protein
MKQFEELGYYAAHYNLSAPAHKTLPELKERLLVEPVRYTGWPPFWFPTRPEIAPRIIDAHTYECVHDGSGNTRHVEKWRASTTGEFTIMRQHDLDELYPRKYISLVLPVWRIAEVLLQAGRMGEFFESKEVTFTVLFTGLKGRELSTKEVPGRFLSDGHKTYAEEYRQSITVAAPDIDRQVAVFTEKLLGAFYHLFEFQLPRNLCEQEIVRMRSNRF